MNTAQTTQIEALKNETNASLSDGYTLEIAEREGGYRVWIEEPRTDGLASNASDGGYTATAEQLEAAVELLLDEAHKAGILAYPL